MHRLLFLGFILLLCISLAACKGGGDDSIFDLPDGFNDQVQLTNQSASTVISQPENPGTVSLNDGSLFNFRAWLLERDGDDFDVREMTSEANYTIISGADNVEISGDGQLRAIDPGDAVIEVSSGGNQCRLNIDVN
jgi:hypothetical protein